MSAGARVLTAASLALVLSGIAAAASGSHDPRDLSRGEEATLLPLVCRNAHIGSDKEYHCASLIAYPGSQFPSDMSFRFLAVAYGGFTQPKVDEAYATYYSSNEPHANNWGGGILFRRSDGRWKLTKWYPGEQMDRCVALPTVGLQRMLCLGGWLGQGEVDTNVSVRSLATSGGNYRVLSAQDTRRITFGNGTGCKSGVPKGQAWLLSIDDLTRSRDPAFLATSRVSYETSEDIAKACSGPHTRKVHETKGIVKYRVRNDEVTAATPIAFKQLDN